MCPGGWWHWWLLEVTLAWGEPPLHRVPVPAGSGAGLAVPGNRLRCQNRARKEADSEAVFVTFVLLFFYSGRSPSTKQSASRGILL